MTTRVKDTIRRILRLGPEPEAGPVETPFIRHMECERALSEQRRRERPVVNFEREYLRKRYDTGRATRGG